MRPRDVVVVGAGPNGLAAAIVLAREGLDTLLVEARSTPGGGSRTSELTLPGFRHDVCSTVHPLGVASPFFRAIDLERRVAWIDPPSALAHVIDERGWVAKLWTPLRPHVMRYASSLRAGATKAAARSELLNALKSTAPSDAEGLAARVERGVANLVHRALSDGLLRSMMGSVDRGDDAAWQDVERAGLRRAGEAVGDIVARMFHGPALICLAITVAEDSLNCVALGTGKSLEFETQLAHVIDFGA